MDYKKAGIRAENEQRVGFRWDCQGSPPERYSHGLSGKFKKASSDMPRLERAQPKYLVTMSTTFFHRNFHHSPRVQELQTAPSPCRCLPRLVLDCGESV